MNIGSSPVVSESAVISLTKWLAQIGVTACTAWRWRRKGWLKTVNICGRQYLTQRAIEEFNRRAAAGEFAKHPKFRKERVRNECGFFLSAFPAKGIEAFLGGPRPNRNFPAVLPSAVGGANY